MRYALEYCRLSLQKIAQYRVNFMLSAMANIVHYGTSLALITILMGRFKAINGWTQNEVILLYAFALLSFSIFGLFFQQLSHFSNMVIQGNLDRILLRPRSVFLQVVLEGINPIYLSHFLFGATMFAYAAIAGNFRFGPDDFFLLAIAVVSGAVIQLSVAIVASTISFFTKESNSIFYLLIYAPRELIWYPIGIYPWLIKYFIIFVVPFAFINYFPIRTVLGVQDGFPALEMLGWMSPLVAAATAGIAALAWRYGLSRYSSSGS